MHTRILFALLALAVGGLPAKQVLGEITITTFPDWNGTSLSFGFLDNTYPVATIGQVFTAPTGATTLDEFKFSIASYSPTAAYRAMLMSWNVAESHPTGPALFAQDATAMGNFSPAIFDTGGLSVTAGASYVAFVTVLPFLSVPHMGAIGDVHFNDYTGGNFVIAYGANDVDSLTTARWGVAQTDLAFSVTFSDSVVPPSGAVPEPATYGLVGALSLLGVAAMRRKSKFVELGLLSWKSRFGRCCGK